jgi:hypothetical protein
MLTVPAEKLTCRGRVNHQVKNRYGRQIPKSEPEEVQSETIQREQRRREQKGVRCRETGRREEEIAVPLRAVSPGAQALERRVFTAASVLPRTAPGSSAWRGEAGWMARIAASGPAARDQLAWAARSRGALSRTERLLSS